MAGDDHHLLERFRRNQAQARILAHEVRRVFDEGVDTTQRATRDPVDAVRLRGIPAVGPNMAGGAIRGTRPDVEALKLDKS